jgi:hypothetical protein
LPKIFRVHFAGTCLLTLLVHVPAAHQREPVRTWHLRAPGPASATATVAARLLPRTQNTPPPPGAPPTNEHRPRRHPHPPPHALRLLLPQLSSSLPIPPSLSLPIYIPPPRHALPTATATATATPPAPNQWRPPPRPRTPTRRPHLRRRSSRLLAARTSSFSRGGTDRWTLISRCAAVWQGLS